MSDLSADTTVISSPAGEPWPGPTPPGEGWSRRKFITVFLFVLTFHVALIFLLGTKKQIVSRAVTNVPHLQLVDRRDEFIALNDPTLFARPNEYDIVSAYWRQMDEPSQPNFNWSVDPRYLSPPTNDLGGVFREFLHTNRLAEFTMDFKPAPRAIAPESPPDNAIPHSSTLQLSDELTRRGLLNAVSLPTPPFNDVVARSKVQVLVERAGNVASVTLLQSSTAPDIDQTALQLAARLRFAPASDLTVGEITFNWHTVPINSASNAAPASVP